MKNMLVRSVAQLSLLLAFLLAIPAATIASTNDGRPETAFFSEKKQKWGFKDCYGDVAIKPKYHYAESFKHGHAIVKVQKQYGIIDQYGFYVVSPKYDLIKYANGVSFIVTIGDKKALLRIVDSKRADVTLSSKYDEIKYSESSDSFIVTKRYFKGILASDGSELIECKCDEVDVRDKRFLVTISGKRGVYNNNGEVVVNSLYDDIIFAPDYMLAFIDNECVVYNSATGFEASRFRFDSCDAVNNDYIFTAGNKSILIADNNYTQQPVLYDSIEALNTDLYVVKSNNRYGVLSACGDVILEPVLNQMDRAKLGRAWQLCQSGDECVMLSPGYKVLSIVEYEKEFNNPWDKGFAVTPKPNHSVAVDAIIPVIEFESIEGSFEEHVGDDTFTHLQQYASVEVGDYTLSLIKHQIEEQYYLYFVKEGVVEHKVLVSDLFSIAGVDDVYKFMLNSVQQLANGDVLLATAYSLLVPNDESADYEYLTIEGQSMCVDDSCYDDYRTKTTSCVVVLDGKDFKPKYSVELSEQSQILGVSNFEGWYVAGIENVFFSTSSQPISKYSNECNLDWRFTANDGEGFAYVCETIDSFYVGGYTKNSGYIGKYNPYVCRLDRRSGQMLGDMLFKQENQDYCVVGFNNGYVDIAPLQRYYGEYRYLSEEVKSHDFSALEPVKLELKQSLYFGIYAYGLVNQYGEWVVKPVLPGEEAVVSGDWTIYPCEAKVVDGKVTISQTPVVKFKGEYVDVDNQKVKAPENATKQAEAFDDFQFVVQEVERETIEEEETFVTVEQMPTFQGGDLGKFRAWVMQHIKYPPIALENGIQGNVVVEFVVEKDGRLSNFQVLQSPDKTLSEAVIDVLKKSPKWKPGKQRKKPVRVAFTLPISFQIKQ